jgi:hypothetical protein
MAALSVAGCQALAPASTATPAPTQTPLPTNTPAPTATPRPTETPVPTATATPVPPTPTPDRTATAEAQAAATTAAYVTQIDAELQKYDLSTQDGHLGWIHTPVTMKLDTYGEYQYTVDYPEVKASDFVVHADIKWDTSTGLAGCGFLLRAADDFERGAQYQFAIVRLAFNPLWDIEYYNHGQFQTNVTGDLLNAPSLDDRPGSTNAVTVIVEGDKMTAYANGERLGATRDSRLTDGTVAFLAWQESGETTCTFTNAWLWIFKDES